jgi:tetratricopeptide (TPR) repeat protein
VVVEEEEDEGAGVDTETQGKQQLLRSKDEQRLPWAAVNRSLAASQMELGRVLTSQGRYMKAAVAYESALELQESTDGTAGEGATAGPGGRGGRLGGLEGLVGRIGSGAAGARERAGTGAGKGACGTARCQLLIDAGNAHLQSGALEPAERRYAEAAKENPMHATAFNNLGVVSFRQKKLDAAIGWFRRCLELEPRHKEALFALRQLIPPPAGVAGV